MSTPQTPEPAAQHPWWAGANIAGPDPGDLATAPAAFPTPAAMAPVQPPDGQYPAGGGGATPPGRPPRGGAIVLGLVLVVALGATLAAVLLPDTGLGRPSPDDAVSEATADLRDWEGVTYRGKIEQYGSGNVDADLTIGRNGDVAGTLTAPNGARAEYARIDGEEMLNAEPAWFADDSRAGEKERRLAGRWVRNPGTDTPNIDRVLDSPDGLAGDLEPIASAGSSFSTYSDLGEETVDDRTGRRLEGTLHEVVVTDGRSPTLLTVRPSASPAPLRVHRASPEALAAIEALRPERDSAPDHNVQLFERAEVDLAWAGEVPETCDTPECSASIQVTNPMPFPIVGELRVTVNGVPAGRHAFDLGPGGSATFTTTVENESFDGTPVPVAWDAEARGR